MRLHADWFNQANLCRKWLAALALWSAVTYSLPPHKEFRFLLPALQLAMPFGGVALEYLRGDSVQCATRSHRLPSSGAAAETNDEATVSRTSAVAADDQQAHVIGPDNEEAPAAACPAASTMSSSAPPHLQQSLRHWSQPSEAMLQQKCPPNEGKGSNSGKSASDSKQSQRFPALYRTGVVSVVLQIPAALYFGLRHQRCITARALLSQSLMRYTT